MIAHYRSAVLKGVMAAERAHRDVGSRQRVERYGTNIDVFGAVARLGVPLLLRPLDGLLGAYLCVPSPGVLITTRRPLGVQRFTAAHELGHFRLKHEPSLDGEDILRGPPFTPGSGCPLQEVEADAFAMGFLMPRWLISWHAKRQGWDRDCLSRPHVVYQLSLRLGASFEATWRTLLCYGLIASDIAAGFRKVKVRNLKKALLGNHVPSDYRRDVWLLTQRDADTSIAGSKHDLFVFRLEEHCGGGYLWEAAELERNGFSLVGDVREEVDRDGIGNPAVRRLTAAVDESERGRVSLHERRPWQPERPLNRLDLAYDLTGPENEGYSRVERRRMLEVA